MKLWDRQGFRLGLFVFVLMDVAGVFVYQGMHPTPTQDFALIATGLGTAAVSVARLLGWLDKDSGGVKVTNLDTLFGDRYVQVFIVFFTVLLGSFLIPAFISPRFFNLNVVVHSSDGPDTVGWAGEATLILQQQKSEDAIWQRMRPVKFGENRDVFNDLEVDKKGMYTISLRPFDQVAFDSGSVARPVDGPTVNVDLIHRKHLLIYDLFPRSGRLALEGGPDPQLPKTLSGQGQIELVKGAYSYRFTAGGDYEIERGTLIIPQDSLRLALQAKAVLISFYADRGVGATRVLIPSSFTVTCGGTTVKSGLRSGESVSLRAGSSYVISAVAREYWDVSSRTYSGDWPFTATVGMHGKSIVIKVREE